MTHIQTTKAVAISMGVGALTMSLIVACQSSGGKHPSQEDTATSLPDTAVLPDSVTTEAAGSDSDSATNDHEETDTVDRISDETDWIPDSDARLEGCVIHINKETGNDGNDGESWETAVASLPKAMALAKYSECEEIWVAAGVYFATQTDDVTRRIELIDNVDVYGGFVGSETARSMRNPEINQTVISGAIDGGKTEILVVGADRIVFDGFTLESAVTAWSSDSIHAIIRNCTFLYNTTGIADLKSRLGVSNCLFDLNGDGILADTSTLTIESSTFGGEEVEARDDIGNKTAVSVTNYAIATIRDSIVSANGTGISSQSSELNIDASTFTGNNRGIYIADGRLILGNSEISSSKIDAYGAGIRSTGATLTIANSLFLGNSSGKVDFDNRSKKRFGGAIYCENSTVDISGSTFENNTVEYYALPLGANRGYGGAIAMVGRGNLTISETAFKNNRTGEGGAIYAEGSITMTDSVFEDNGGLCIRDLRGDYPTVGGAIYGRSVQATDCLFSNNDSCYGGAVYLGSGDSVFTACRFLENRTTDFGGALRLSDKGGAVLEACDFSGNTSDGVGGAVYSTGVLSMSRVTLTDNIADNGGAVFNSGTMDFSNVYMENNAAYNTAGGVFNSGVLDLSNTTILRSTSLLGNTIFGSGVYHDPESEDGTQTRVADSIVTLNNVYETVEVSGGDLSVVYSSLQAPHSGGGNISGDPLFVTTPLATTVTTENGTDDTVVIEQFNGLIFNGFIIEIGNDGVARTVTSVDNERVTFSPAFEDSASSVRGITVDIWGDNPTSLEVDTTLRTDSPCINAGNPAATTEATDLAGNPRVVNDIVDMGAFEMQ